MSFPEQAQDSSHLNESQSSNNSAMAIMPISRPTVNIESSGSGYNNSCDIFKQANISEISEPSMLDLQPSVNQQYKIAPQTYFGSRVADQQDPNNLSNFSKKEEHEQARPVKSAPPKILSPADILQTSSQLTKESLLQLQKVIQQKLDHYKTQEQYSTGSMTLDKSQDEPENTSDDVTSLKAQVNYWKERYYMTKQSYTKVKQQNQSLREKLNFVRQTLNQ